MAAPAGVICPHCDVPGQTGLFCQSCQLYMADETASMERVTYNRRWLGNLLESVLILVTLLVGWLIWLYFTAQTSQTPAKRLVNVYIIDTDTGLAATAGKVWIRDILVKVVLFSVANAFLFSIPALIDALWIFFDKNRQTLHDKIAGTVVAYAPAGIPQYTPTIGTPTIEAHASPAAEPVDVAERLRELSRLREQGILTEEEYAQKRKELAEQL